MTGFSLQTMPERKVKRLNFSARLPFFYVEKAVIAMRVGHVTALSKGLEETLPVAAMALLLLGPGCSITTEAAKAVALRGCCLCFSGGGGIPVFSDSVQYRSPAKKISQYRLATNERTRRAAALTLMHRRNVVISRHSDLPMLDLPPQPPVESDEGSYPSVTDLLLREARWAKAAYAHLAKRHGANWKGKAAADSSHQNPLALLNHFSYSVAASAIMHLGLDPNLGFVHGRNRGGGLVFDLADVYKPILSLEPAFAAMGAGRTDPKDLKADFIKCLRRTRVQDEMVATLTAVIP